MTFPIRRNALKILASSRVEYGRGEEIGVPPRSVATRPGGGDVRRRDADFRPVGFRRRRAREATTGHHGESLDAVAILDDREKRSDVPLLAGERKGATKARRNAAQRDTADGTLQPGSATSKVALRR
jgi:hypothetical protein